jgi:S-adenosylmethionine/arginine decarboxylase-like enzyme
LENTCVVENEENKDSFGSGILIALDGFVCRNNDALREYADSFLDALLNSIKENGMTSGGHRYLQFYDKNGEPDGFSISIILYESHVNFHSWPGLKKFNADVYTCNVSKNNTGGAENIIKFFIEYFEPEHTTINRIYRL